MRRSVVIGLASFSALVLAEGCNYFATGGPSLPCSGRICVLAIQNDAPVGLAVRYADTTGREGVLGVVNPRAMRVFRIQWIRSDRLRLMVLTRDGGRYDATVPLPATRATQVHFPDDFTLVDDDRSAVLDASRARAAARR